MWGLRIELRSSDLAAGAFARLLAPPASFIMNLNVPRCTPVLLSNLGMEPQVEPRETAFLSPHKPGQPLDSSGLLTTSLVTCLPPRYLLELPEVLTVARECYLCNLAFPYLPTESGGLPLAHTQQPQVTCGGERIAL